MSSTENMGKRTDDNTENGPSPLPTSDSERQQSLRSCVEVAINNYFQHLDGQKASNVYRMVMSEVELPLLEAVMKYTQQNQTEASSILGLNRGTLRKKLKKYGLIID